MPKDPSISPDDSLTASRLSPEAASRVAHIQLDFDVRQGSRVQVTVETSPLSRSTAMEEPGVSVRSVAVPTAPVPAPLPPQAPVIQTPVAKPAPASKPSPAAAAPPVQRSAPANLVETLRQQVSTRLESWAKAVKETPLWRSVERWPLATWLFGLALLLYLGTRLFALNDYPIYFFSDEAVHTVRAAELVSNGFTDPKGVFLPTYMLNYPFYNIGASVYVQVLPYLMFGKTVFVTRATSVFITLLAALAVGLSLRDIFGIPYWWSGALLLSVTPAWFLHSRTAFEVVEMTSFYAGALYFYWLYRQRDPRYLYVALVFGALAFYTYTPGQLVMPATAGVLLLSDWRYHWKNRKTILTGLLVAAVLALPYVRFQLSNPGLSIAQLRERGSWLVQPIPLSDKLGQSLSEYVYGLTPHYWYGTNGRDLARHVMQGYGHLWMVTAPFAVAGLVLAVRRWRSAPHRALVLVWLVSPSAAWLAEVGITRVLMLVIPAVLFMGLGLAAVLEWLEKRPPFTRRRLSIGVWVLLAGFNLFLLRDALVNGPTWTRDYGLYGTQYGARQLFGKLIPDYLNQHREVNRLHVSPVWANGTGLFADFFLTPGQKARVVLDSLDAYIKQKVPLSPAEPMILTAPEYETARQSQKFKDVTAEQTLNYPDGTPAFYLVHLAYADNVDAVFAAEQEVRRQLVETTVEIGGQAVKVRYSQIDGGTLEPIFDGDWGSLVRGAEANPFVLEFIFPQPRPVTGIAADFGSMDLTLHVKLHAPDSDTPVDLSQSYPNQPPDPHVEMKFENPPPQVAKMRVEILNLLAGEAANIHIREFKVLP